MGLIDIFLPLLLLLLIIFHLLAVPYTKVEESFNLQATHDILVSPPPLTNISSSLYASYDHLSFPGAVPRSFLGAAILATVSRPIISLTGPQHGQFVVRAVLGLFNGLALLRYGQSVERAFGKGAGRWFWGLMVGQFQVLFYASRTLPNMFAFGLSTLALREYLPIPVTNTPGGVDQIATRNRVAIYLLVFAGIVFRAELAVLLATQLLYLLWLPRISLQNIVPTGLRSAALALAISVPIDSYFWQRLIWPELASFFYNAIQGKSTDWGRSPFYAYFTFFLPKLLLNPATPLLIPNALYFPATRRAALGLVVPSLAFITIYSLQPHKEARFIIYAVPPLTACAAMGANYIFTRRTRSLLNQLLSLAIVASIIGSFVASALMLAISSLNYPGGEALYRLHEIVALDQPTSPGPIYVHMDVLSCMTGVSRFQQDYPSPPFSLSPLLSDSHLSSVKSLQDHQFRYDKTESPSILLDPLFWSRFDYVLTAEPETAIGAWEILETIDGYAGMQVLRPGEGFSSSWFSGAVVDGGVEGRSEAEVVAEAAWVALGGGQNGIGGVKVGVKGGGDRKGAVGVEAKEKGPSIYIFLREGIREYITRGWWVQPRVEPKIMILRRAGGAVSS